MKKIFCLLLLAQLACTSQTDCPEGINLLPMYGDVKKCALQLKLDEEFILESEKQFGDRREASVFYVDKGWDYFNRDDFDTAMKRFNQAWLLDPNHPQIYWGFGNILGKKGAFEQSVNFLEQSIAIEPKNPNVYESLATSYGQLYLKTQKETYMNLRIKALRKAVALSPKKASAYGELANSYAYFTQKDSLIKYIKITDDLDPTIISDEVRAMARKK